MPAEQRLVVVPVITPGWAVLAATASAFATELPQTEFAVTLMLPDTKVDEKVTETMLVP